MNLKEYTGYAIRTAATPTPCDERELNIVHFLIGVQTEVNELILESTEPYQLKEEIGDLLWYCALGANTIGLTLDDIELLPIDDVDPEVYLQIVAMNCCDTAKRMIFYRKPIEDHEVAQLIGFVLSTVERLLNLYRLDYEEVMEANIEKLRVRYPDKYTDFHALNRNLLKEKRVLEN